MPQRCSWPGDDPDEMAYHDLEWGVPTRDEAKLFEALTLEGAQAGLSWHTILMRRDGYRRAFLDWNIEAIAEIDEAGVDLLVQDTGIIRHRGKIESTIANARATLLLREQGLSIADIVWPTQTRQMSRAPKYHRRPMSRKPCLASSSVADFASSDRQPAMPSCRQSGSSTITMLRASDSQRLPKCAVRCLANGATHDLPTPATRYRRPDRDDHA